jgi:hypothetical protein
MGIDVRAATAEGRSTAGEDSPEFGDTLRLLEVRDGASPDRIVASSLGETIACSSGVSRAANHQTIPTAPPSTALNQNAERQPWLRMSHVSNGGVSPLPAPTPAKIRPLIKPRSPTGIHRATN